jgi:hypothetical protein
MRFLSTRGVNMEGHEFQYFRSPQGDELILRQSVGGVSRSSPIPPAGGPAYRTLDELAKYVEDETVRKWIAAIQGWSDELPFHPDVRFAVPGNGIWSVRFRGKTRAQGYFAKRWAFVWWPDRFGEDVEWFKQRLSAPDQVRVDGNGTLRFHIRTTDDLETQGRLTGDLRPWGNLTARGGLLPHQRQHTPAPDDQEQRRPGANLRSRATASRQTQLRGESFGVNAPRNIRSPPGGGPPGDRAPPEGNRQGVD